MFCLGGVLSWGCFVLGCFIRWVLSWGVMSWGVMSGIQKTYKMKGSFMNLCPDLSYLFGKTRKYGFLKSIVALVLHHLLAIKHSTNLLIAVDDLE